MKPTAVEFAVEQLEQLIPFGHQLVIRSILEQALEREKEDLKEAFFEGWIARDGKLTFTKAKNKWFKELKENKI